MDIFDQLKTEALLGLINNIPQDGYLTFNVDKFKSADDYPKFKCLAQFFNYYDFVLVNFSGGIPNAILSPVIWRDGDELVYRMGNESFPIYADDKGIYIQGGLCLEYDTKQVKTETGDDVFLTFSFIIDNFEYQTDIIYIKDDNSTPKFNVSAHTNHVKTLIRAKKFQEAINALLPRVRTVPKIVNSSTIGEVFRPIMSIDGEFEKVCNFLGGKLAVLISDPYITSDKYGINLNFSFDGAGFVERLKDGATQKIIDDPSIPDHYTDQALSEILPKLDYTVKSWGKEKPLSSIQQISFKHNHINDVYLKNLVSDVSKSKFCVLIITSPNHKNKEWPPMYSIVSDEMILGNIAVKKLICGFLGVGDDFKFPERSMKHIEALPAETFYDVTEDKGKYLKAANGFNFS